jgi:diguanylate cyclase
MIKGLLTISEHPSRGACGQISIGGEPGRQGDFDRMRARRADPSASLQTAEAALEEIAARGQAADPKSFALWFNFAAGDSGLLTAAMHKKLARNGGRLTPEEVDDLYATHVSPAGIPDRAEKLSAQVGEEIEQVMAMISAAAGSASAFAASLAQGARRLGAATDEAGVRAIVEDVTLATTRMELANISVHDQLQAAIEEIGRRRREIGALRNKSLTDPLTSLGNRKFFDSAVEKAVAHCHASGDALSLLLVDVDHFKKINDTYGHVVGDRVLRFVGATLKESLKGKDISARCGGDVFAVILPRTAMAASLAVAEQLRQAIMKGELVRRSTGEKHSTLTVSIGVASLAPGASAQSLVEAASVCLHAAKRSDHNCVVGENDERLLEAL